MNDFAKGLVADVERVTKKWRKQREREIRDANARSRRRDVFVRRRPVTIVDAAREIMKEAYAKASKNGTLPCTPRQIFYAARPYIQNATNRTLDSGYFTQTVLTQYVEETGVDWDIVWDARGTFHEPHTGLSIPLSALAVRGYVFDTESRYLPATRDRSKWHTKGAKDRYGAVLFCEKEGFQPLFQATQLAERFDLAIMSTKGLSTTAARTLIDELVEDGIPVFAIRDFDVSGFMIAGTLRRDTDRYSWFSTGAVDLGLRLEDVLEHRMESEAVYYVGRGKRILYDRKQIAAKIGPGLRLNGATQAEIEFLIDARVELNAFASDQLIAWIESKLVKHGVKKVIPSQETMAAAVRGFARDAIAERYLKVLADDLAKEVDAFDPGDIAAAVTAMLAENPAMSWDEAVELIVRRNATDKETAGGERPE